MAKAKDPMDVFDYANWLRGGEMRLLEDDVREKLRADFETAVMAVMQDETLPRQAKIAKLQEIIDAQDDDSDEETDEEADEDLKAIVAESRHQDARSDQTRLQESRQAERVAAWLRS